jgi:TonB-dependent SusC/RagA subfamily outer membrane receptor
VSNSHHRPHRALTAILIAPLCTLLACASGGAKARGPAPARAASDTAAGADVPDLGGKTVERLFAGRFPGVSVMPSPGGGLQIRIRGGSNSFYSSNEPLYLIDGTPLPENTGGIVFLNPYDIETIEVLKNPADVGIYGIRGSNGVIRITTMRPGPR